MKILGLILIVIAAGAVFAFMWGLRHRQVASGAPPRVTRIVQIALGVVAITALVAADIMWVSKGSRPVAGAILAVAVFAGPGLISLLWEVVRTSRESRWALVGMFLPVAFFMHPWSFIWQGPRPLPQGLIFNPGGLGFLFANVAVIVGTIAGALAGHIVDRAARSRRRAEGHCPGCGYSLRGLEEPRCPECGQPVRPRDLPTAAPVPPRAESSAAGPPSPA